jgi:hypothetical protein
MIRASSITAELRGTRNPGLAPNRPVYWVGRGVPVVDRGMRVTNSALHHQSFYDPAEAVALCKAFRGAYPDGIVVCEQPV